eukprot:352968-Chlamydomonas_euryale.AAC.5
MAVSASQRHPTAQPFKPPWNHHGTFACQLFGVFGAASMTAALQPAALWASRGLPDIIQSSEHDSQQRCGRHAGSCAATQLRSLSCAPSA